MCLITYFAFTLFSRGSMAYGIFLNNKFGERVLDFDYALYKKGAGSCAKWPTDWYEQTGVPIGRGHMVPNLTGGRIISLYQGSYRFKYPVGGTSVGCLPQFAASHLNYFGYRSGYDNFAFYPEPFGNEKTLVFFELDENGITQSYQSYQPYYEELTPGVMAIVQPFHTRTTALEYVYADATPVGGHSELFGMQVFNEVGGLVFDSRENFLNIKDHITISENQMADVIDNGAAIEFTLRTPVENPLVCAINFDSNDFIVSGSASPNIERGYTNYLPRLHRVNSTTLRLERAIYGMYFPAYSGGPVHNRNVKSATILVAER